jgi:hypothetical protein
LSTDLARRDQDYAPSQEIAHAIAGTMDQLKAIRTFVKEQFQRGIDAGKIPGCGDKDVLLLPGAQKATMYFNCYPTYRTKEKDLGNGHVDFRVRCLLISRATREQVGEGIGCASTKEKKFKRGGSAKPCPSCQAPAIMKSKEEYGGGWYCNAKAGGCGAKFAKGHKGLSEAREVEVADDSAYEVRNTVLKMAKKRAHVDAAMTLGCLSELFTQDIEDTYQPSQVRDAARPYDGEVGNDYAPEPPEARAIPQNHSGHGKGMYASPEQVIEFNAWVSDQCQKINRKWAEEWDAKAEGWMAEGHRVPEKIDEVINPWQAKGHLLKWAIDTDRLDPSIVPEESKTRQADGFVAIVYHRTNDDGMLLDRRALKAEFTDYLKKRRQVQSDKVYRKHPELAPAGWAEEQAEGHGDAYDGPVQAEEVTA